MPKFSYLLNEKLNVNGKKIYCKVTGEANSVHDGQPYILIIAGGPGFSHELTELHTKRFLLLAAKEKATLPHFIFFDNLGCGQSDKATDPDKEYTIDFFTDLSITLIEVIKKKLGLSHMRLCVDGGSFGSLVAMNFPTRKPEWLNKNSDIQLMQITSKVGPNGSNMKEYTFNFLKTHYADHFNYKNMLAAQEKLFSGNIHNQTDYLQNFVLPMATLYVKNIDQSASTQALFTLVNQFPNRVISAIDWLNWSLNILGLTIEALEFYNIMLGKCSLEVLNHFFKTDFCGFNLIEVVKKNKQLYEQIPICLIAASEDHIVDCKTAETIHQILPDTSALLTFKDAHMISKGVGRDIYNQINYALSVSHCIKHEDVNHELLKYNIPPVFKEKLLAIQSQIAVKNKTEISSPPIRNNVMELSFFSKNPEYGYAAAIATTVACGLVINSLIT